MNKKIKNFCVSMLNSLYIGYKIPLLPYSINILYNNKVIRILRCLGGVCFIMYVTGYYLLLSESIIDLVLCMVIVHTMNVILILICKVVYTCNLKVFKSISDDNTVNRYVICLIVLLRIVFLLVLECIGILGFETSLYFDIYNHIHDIKNCSKKR
jgi:hypothetical protein